MKAKCGKPEFVIEISVTDSGKDMKWFASWIGLCGVILFTQTLESYANDELDVLIATAMEQNPRVLSAQYQLDQALANRDQLRGFFDPHLSLTLEQADSILGYNQSSLRGGTDMAVLPGAYLGARVEENYLDHLKESYEFPDVESEYDHLMQSLAGLRLGIPLLRDRGFYQWKLSDDQAFKQYSAARNHLLAVTQAVRHEIEQQYINVLEALALGAVARSATGRVEKLLAEAETLVKLKTVPEYQLFAARSEVALRQEEETSARQVYETRLSHLAELLGQPDQKPEVTLSPEVFIQWADAVNLPPTYSEEQAKKARGDYCRLVDQIGAAEAEKALNADNLRSDLSLNVEMTLQGEDPDRIIATDHYLSERGVGGVIGLTWRRPWGYRAERARVRALDATLSERRELLRQADLRIRTELEVTHREFRLAQTRFRLVSSAVSSAQQALEAEDERFRLGEGRSRNVLDAQKDLTETLKRRTLLSAELLRTYFNFLFSSGYDMGHSNGMIK